jgi:virginiamycin B lyase
MRNHFTVAGLLCSSLLGLAGTPQPAAALPSGEARDMVETTCAGCHGLHLIERSSGYTQAQWVELIGTMIDLSGTAALDEMAAYLAEHFPPNDRRAPVLVPANMQLRFTEWVSPTPGQRTRDPVEAPDGSIWWAGQWADIAGRIDPETGEQTEFLLPADARPHTVTADTEGNIWYMGNGNGTIGMIEPESGEISVHDMPEGQAGDPHSAIFDDNGMLWFTAQRANQIGRLDPTTGAVDIVNAPVPNSRPYGIKIAPDGAPWVAANGSNRLYRVDPATMEITEFELPGDGTHVRRLDFASDGTVWFVNSGMGRIGNLDPETGTVREWDSPSGPGSHPYAIAVINDVVWYNESAQRPDPLVRFDPATETFESWAIPSGGFHAGIIRHMRPTRDGNLLIHQSSTNRVIRVEIGG